ncbi:MAG TPA: hypothetical protein DCM28_21565 [Phycisphaerales bacterium]|nr:hypothetical protein [Phycisphaerales bacterium]
MLSLLLAQTGINDGNVFDVVNSIFARGDTLAHPEDFPTALRSMSIVWGTIFLVAGLVTMLNGYKCYKTVIIVTASAIGAFAGYALGKQLENQAAYIVAGCLSILMAVGCWPLMKYAVAVIGGMAGAFIGANTWASIAAVMKDTTRAEAMMQNYWIGALIGLLVCGMLSFIVFKFSVVMFTSFGGSTIAVFGAIALLLQVPLWQETVQSSLTAHPIVIPLLIAVPSVIGLIMQQQQNTANVKKPDK